VTCWAAGSGGTLQSCLPACPPACLPARLPVCYGWMGCNWPVLAPSRAANKPHALLPPLQCLTKAWLTLRGRAARELRSAHLHVGCVGGAGALPHSLLESCAAYHCSLGCAVPCCWFAFGAVMLFSMPLTLPCLLRCLLCSRPWRSLRGAEPPRPGHGARAAMGPRHHAPHQVLLPSLGCPGAKAHCQAMSGRLPTFCSCSIVHGFHPFLHWPRLTVLPLCPAAPSTPCNQSVAHHLPFAVHVKPNQAVRTSGCG
jgi:hypothetical protein